MKTFDDFRNIAFLIEENDDKELYEYLSKDLSYLNSVDKFLVLLNQRMKSVDDNIALLGEDSRTVNISLNLFLNSFKENYKDIKQTINIDDFFITLNYPRELYHESYEEVINDSIETIIYKDKNLNMVGLSMDDKMRITEQLPGKVSYGIISTINKNAPILLMDSRLGIPKTEISFFDNSAYDLIKILYNVYTSNDIIETIFFLSKRISDISYLNTRTPKEINQLVKLYSDEVEKMNK